MQQRKLPRDQAVILRHLGQHPGKLTVDHIALQVDLDQVLVSAALHYLEQEGLIALEVETYTEVRLGKQGEGFAGRELPERSIINALAERGAAASIAELAAMTSLEQKVIGQCVKVLRDKGWALNQAGALTLTETGKEALHLPGADDQVLALLGEQGKLILERLSEQQPELAQGVRSLEQRANFLRLTPRKLRFASLTDQGRALVTAGIVDQVEVTSLTPDLLKDGRWREVDFKPYNIQDLPEQVWPGKRHPFLRVLDETRRTYLDMGFTEVVSPHVESAFWDFDALFQPQDHPARDMQDTFYVRRPDRAELPDASLVERVRRTHQDGGDTGSKGWRYTWNQDLARRTVLRTHTTAASIRALHAHPQAPLKVFCIGRVFRRETIDYKHLPVFYQVDGIIVDEQASLANLIHVLSEFYRKMGFPKIDVRPSFFPYTEPSLEVYVYMEERKDWVEMGGAGIFRPEVTEPLGCTSPVLAWGLGLERLAMFRYRLKDIREIYLADLAWLREVPLCQ